MSAWSRRAVFAVATCLSLAGCAGSGRLGGLGRSLSPYERYADTLRHAGLDQTALGREWARAGEASLQNAAVAVSPFSETGYVSPDRPSAASYRIDLRRGRRLMVEVTFHSVEPARLFVDLFQVQNGAPPRLVASLPADAATLSYDVRQDGEYVLRVQPELLRGGRFTVAERTVSSLIFPVSGLTARAVQSSFGAARDAGIREHEGIDIFASRGAPVVAVRDGLAQPDTNPLGGNVVWLHDRMTGQRFYYAHLDRWALENSSAVRTGDVLGYVGNTGNARATSPHLHFGIYEGTAIDPLPFLQPDEEPPAAPVGPVDRLGALVRVVPARATLRAGAGRGAPGRLQLEQGTVARVVGLSQSAIRVVLPDDSVGYLDAGAVTSAQDPVRRQRLAAGAVLREAPIANAPVVDTLAVDLQVDVLGRSGVFDLVRMQDGRVSWVDRP